MTSPERQLEEELIEKLRDLKYEHRTDIRDRAALEKNFREKFEALNRVRLTDGEFQRLLDEIIAPDVFTAARTLREINSFPLSTPTSPPKPKSSTSSRPTRRASCSSCSRRRKRMRDE